MTLESIEKLREQVKRVASNSLIAEITVDVMESWCDEIQAEIESKYILLPVDVDGVPIHVGDKLIIGVLNKITCTVEKLEFDGYEWWYKSGDDCFVCSAAHHVPRTLEDVLRDVWEEALDYAKSNIWRNPDEVFAERADEIRTMFGES